MEQPKISVVILVYRVEPYLRKCLDSVVGQTYRNLEIILVDNGSPDSCGAICDEYAARDKRIRVLHLPENIGRAGGHNRGLDVATGEWIGTVDSDDWIEPDMFEYLIDNALEAGADVSVCGWVEEWPDQESISHTVAEGSVLGTEQAMELYLVNLDEISNSLWNKLFRRELYEGIRDPEGEEYGDAQTLWKLLSRASRVTYLSGAKYHWFHRPGSITVDQPLSYIVEGTAVYARWKEEIGARWPQFRSLLGRRWGAAFVIVAWCSYYTYPRAERQACLPQLQQAAAAMKKSWRDAGTDAAQGLAGRLVLRLTPYATWWSFALCRLIDLLYQARHGEALGRKRKRGK